VYTAVVGGLAVLVIGIACAVCYPIVSDELERARLAKASEPAATNKNAQAAAPSASDSEPDDPSERCELRVFRDQPGGETIVVLTQPGKMTEYGPKQKDKDRSRLIGELVRQSVLVALREGLNLPVRDAIVGDPEPKGQPAQVLEVDSLFRGSDLILVCAGTGPKREVLLKESIIHHANDEFDYRQLVETLEPLTREAIVAALGKAGIAGKAVAKKGEDRLPEGVEEQLGRMAFTAQFAALRSLHGAIRTDGPSPRRLGALSRAYANLGLLTEYQWDAASAAYKARGLLYAQRMIALEPKSPQSFWHRAYAAAMAGRPTLTGEDIDTARRLAAEQPAADRPAPPGWAALIEAWRGYAAERLAAANSGPDAELAALLRLLTLEYPPMTDVALRAARAAISANPECFRAHDALCEVSGIANLHVATTLAPEVLSQAVPRRIASMKDVPAAARKAAERADEVAMTQGLDDASIPAGDLAEPSWGALARIVRETRFAFTYRRLDFMAYKWSVPTDDYWEEVRPLVAAHRFRPFLEAHVTGGSRPDLRSFFATLDTTDLGVNAIPLIAFEARLQAAASQERLTGIMWSRADTTVRDISKLVTAYQKKPGGVNSARQLLRLSPNSPFAMAELIENAWSEAEKKVPEWQKEGGDHPTFVAAMARHYVAAAQTDPAEKALKRSIELSPDHWAFKDLAEVYRKKGDMTRAKEVLDDFLTKVEDHGLDHATVRVAIADDLMKDGRYAEAWPYAEAAARTWAGWAMTCAQNCAEGLEKWDTAEAYARASSERYPGSMWAVWFLFCERTGHGDLAAARAFTKDISSELLENPDLTTDSLLLVSYVQLLCGDKAKAAAALRRMPKNTSEQIYMISMAATGDLAGAPEVRDAALERFCTSYKTSAPNTTQVFQLIRDAIAAKKPGELDLKAIDGIFEKVPFAGTAGAAFVVAGHLMANGHKDLARRYWQRASHQENPSIWWRVFALSILRQHYPNQAGGNTGPREV
jgi:tetratricopeptide (TPR) repeat protein